MEEHLRGLDNSFGCVSNAGVDGHSTFGHQFSFKEWFPLIPDLRPKIILLYVGVNDANFLRGPSPNPGDTTSGIKHSLKSFKIVQELLPIYRIFRQQNNYVYGHHAPSKLSDDDYTVKTINEKTALLSKKNAVAFRSRMKTILNNIHSLGAKPLCVTQPHRYVIEKEGVVWGVKNVLGDGFSGIDYDYSLRQLNQVIFDLCKANTIDLYNHEFADSHFYDGVHTTATGSEEIGKIIVEFIVGKPKP
jgi:lysophospholipase L1-like esterase